MARFRCECGGRIRTSGEIPNPLEWRLLSDEQFDDFHGVVAADDLYRAATIAYRCPSCDRLWIYWDGFDGEPTVYTPPGPPSAAGST